MYFFQVLSGGAKGIAELALGTVRHFLPLSGTLNIILQK